MNIIYSRISIVRISKRLKINSTYEFFKLYTYLKRCVKNTSRDKKKIRVIETTIETRQYILYVRLILYFDTAITSLGSLHALHNIIIDAFIYADTRIACMAVVEEQARRG